MTCVIDSATGTGLWQPTNYTKLCPTEGCGTEGKHPCNANSLMIFNLTGVVTSPNYPNSYPSNLNHTNIIKVDEGLLVTLQFEDFTLGHYNDDFTCNGDHLTITDGDGTIMMDAICGFETPPNMITSRSNTVEIQFVTDSNVNWRGWRLGWRAMTPGALGLLI